MKTRPLTLAGLAACALLLTLAVLLANGSGRDPDWLEPLPAPVQRSGNVAPVAAPSIADQRLALIWQQPLFSPDRHPDPATDRAADTGLAGLTLTGVVKAGAGQWAWLRDGQRTLTLKVGASLDNGWQLQTLTARQATFVHEGQTRQLSIPTPRLPPPSAGSGPKLPSPSIVHTDAPSEAEPPVSTP